MINNWLKIIHNTLYPRTCLLCAAPGQEAFDLCRDCHRALPFNRIACPICGIDLPSAQASAPCGKCVVKKPNYDRTLALFRYREPLRYLIRSLKFHSNFASARLLGELMTDHVINLQIEPPELIIPVPLHRKRLWQRGFNQSLEIARPISRAIEVPIAQARCFRTLDTRPQFELQANERHRNIKNAFEVRGRITERRIVIFDDVVTTGATVNEIARVLRKKGAEFIEIWTIARANMKN